MDSKITINIVEPGGPTPDPVVPNTGLFTSGIGGPEATAITAVSAVLILTIAAIVVAILYRKQKKSGKVTKLVHLVDSTKAVLKSKKRITAGLSAIALLASAGTLTTLLANAGKSNTNAVEGDNLTLDVTGGDITIEVGDEPVFAVAEVKATVKEATEVGYTLTAYTDNTDLVSTTDSSKVIPMVTLPEAGGELSALTNNTYGLALEKPTTKDTEVYMPLSTDSDTPTILKATDYEHTEANDTTTIYYGFYITPDVPYGTYTGSDIYYNVEPHYITNLSFNGNGNDGGVEIESRIIPAGDTITLPQNTFTKDGYSFNGWNTLADGTGESYPDQGTYIAPGSESHDITLYAQWKQIFYMQDVATWGSTLTQGNTMEAVDKRDGKTYYVSRLADNKIWMTQNLDLDLISDPTAEEYVALTPANTNIPSNWTPSSSTITIEGTSVPGWQDSATTPYSADPGPLYVYSSGTTDNDKQYTSLEACKKAHPDCSAKNHVGNYYNWSAAVANNNTAGITEPFTNVETSICPAGWRLPTGRDSNDTAASREWNAVLYAEGVASSTTGGGYTSDGFNKIRTAPLWLARSGAVYEGSLNGTGRNGSYWSSTVDGSSAAYCLGFNSGYMNPASYGGRSNGYSVRCVAQ